MHRLGSVSECNSKLNLHLCRQALLTLSSDTFFSTARKRVFFIIIILIVSSIQPEFAIVHPSLYYCLSPSALSLLSHSLSISPSPTNTEQALLFSSVCKTLNAQLSEDACVFIRVLILWLLQIAMP